jgi:hypothetical protein
VAIVKPTTEAAGDARQGVEGAADERLNIHAPYREAG